MTTQKESKRVSEMDIRRNTLRSLQEDIAKLVKKRKDLRFNVKSSFTAYANQDISFDEMLQSVENLVNANNKFNELRQQYLNLTLEQKAQKKIHRDAINQRRKNPVKQKFYAERRSRRLAAFSKWKEKQSVSVA